MGDLQLNQIQNQLINIGEADFQEVCDVYLYHDRKLNAISRTGAKAGKHKVKRGRPDSYFVQDDGSFVFVEATTLDPGKGTKLLQKLKDDWKGCVAFDDPGVKIGRISAIYLCVNSDVPAAYTKELMQMGEQAGIPTRVVSLNELALGIRYRHPTIARVQLQLPVDTGQLLTMDEFVRQYDKSPAVASLSYALYGRQGEMSDLAALIEQHDTVILLGKPGVGKTRLALETLRQFQNTHSSYSLFCLSNKNAELLPDLQIQLADGGDYCILVDDAHRQIDLLRTLVGFYRGKSHGHLKLLLTTRDFMKDIVIRELADFQPGMKRLKPLSPGIIRWLCTGAFHIEDDIVLARIVSLSQGNPRLAVMAARWWQKSRDIDSLRNAEHLYNDYFSHFSDSRLLDDPSAVAALALVGLFHRIDLTNEEFMTKLADAFQLDRMQLEADIHRLGRAEMLDVHENGLVIIADQILGNFAFYRTFIKKRFLSFCALLQMTIPAQQHLLRDILIPLKDMLGGDILLVTLQPDLDRFWKEHNMSRPHALAYLTVFGRYQPELLIAYIWDQIKLMPVVLVREKDFRQQGGLPSIPESYIRLLTSCFEHAGGESREAAALLLEYLTRNPALVNNVEKSLLESMLDTHLDLEVQLERVAALLDLFETKFDRHFIVRDLYGSLMPRYLLRTLMMAHGIRPLQPAAWIDNKVHDIRLRIWQFLGRQFAAFSDEVLDALKLYINLSIEWHIVSTQDLQPFTDLIANHFSPSHFYHCYLVDQLAELLEDTEITFAPLNDLRLRFVNPRFQLFRQLQGLQGRTRSRSDMYAADYQEKMIEYVRTLITINDLREFGQLYTDITDILTYPIRERAEMLHALDIIVHDSYRRNPALGLSIIEHIRDKGNSLGWLPSMITRECLSRSRDAIRNLYNVIRKGAYRDRERWMFLFYACLPPEKVTKGYALEVVAFYPSAAKVDFYWISGLEKFASHLPGFYPKLTTGLLERRRKSPEFSYVLPHDFFLTHGSAFKQTGTLQAELFLQQEEIEEGYDALGRELCCLLPHFPTLLDDLIRQKLARDVFKHVSLRDWSGIWQLPNGEDYILSALTLIGNEPGHYSMKDMGQSFFLKVEEPGRKNALAFCRHFIAHFLQNIPQLDQLLRIARKCLGDDYPILIGHLVQIQDDLGVFRRLQLLSNHFSSTSRDDIWADHRVIEYQVLLKEIRKLPDNFKYSGHITYLQEKIAWEQRMASDERRRRALDSFWSE